MRIIAPHLVKVVMFSGDAHAFLRVDRAGIRAGVGPEEDIFELHHACVGEKQGGIATRHERSTRDVCVAARHKKVDERLTDFSSG